MALNHTIALQKLFSENSLNSPDYSCKISFGNVYSRQFKPITSLTCVLEECEVWDIGFNWIKVA